MEFLRPTQILNSNYSINKGAVVGQIFSFLKLAFRILILCKLQQICIYGNCYGMRQICKLRTPFEIRQR